MDEYSAQWVFQKIKEWEAKRDQAQTEQERERAERELAGYRTWLHNYGRQE